MTPSSHLVDVLQELAKARALNVLAVLAEGTRTRRAVVELSHGPEISLQTGFGFHAQKDGTLSVTYSTVVRWPRAEEIIRDLRPPPPGDPGTFTPEMLEAQNALYPIALLRVDEDSKYFDRPSPVRFASSEFEMIPGLLAEVVDVLVEKVIPQFSCYCDADQLARAAPEPLAKSRLDMQPMCVATILAAAGKKQEFWIWREAYRNGFIGSAIARRKALPHLERYMSALESRWH
jgi:hypothetical protein